MAHAAPTRIPPATAIGAGPSLSTRYPSMGTSQVSASTKMVNATWIDALDQWNLSAMGFTNKVQPYWRLAIIDMQMIPITSWSQRFPIEIRMAFGAVCATVLIL